MNLHLLVWRLALRLTRRLPHEKRVVISNYIARWGR